MGLRSVSGEKVFASRPKSTQMNTQMKKTLNDSKVLLLRFSPAFMTGAIYSKCNVLSSNSKSNVLCFLKREQKENKMREQKTTKEILFCASLNEKRSEKIPLFR
jgi:hypothetical protein